MQTLYYKLLSRIHKVLKKHVDAYYTDIKYTKAREEVLRRDNLKQSV